MFIAQIFHKKALMLIFLEGKMLLTTRQHLHNNTTYNLQHTYYSIKGVTMRHNHKYLDNFTSTCINQTNAHN